MRKACGFIILLCVFILISGAGNAQNCECPPSIISGVYLNEIESSKKNDCSTSNGQTFCMFTCKYKRWNTNQEIWVIGGWVTAVSDPELLPACNNRGSSYWSILSDKKKLAYAHVFSTQGFPDLGYESQRIAKYLIQQLEPFALYCKGAGPPVVVDPASGKKFMGKIMLKSGFVEVYDPATQTWKVYNENNPELFSGQRIRTGVAAKVTIRIHNNTGKEELLDLGEYTIIDIATDPNESTGGVTGFLLKILKGMVSYGRGKPLGMINNSKSRGVTSIETATMAGAIKGTKFYFYHDSLVKKDYFFLKEGKMQLKIGNKPKTILSGQQLYTQNKSFSAVYPLKTATWKKLISGQYLPGPRDFTN